MEREAAVSWWVNELKHQLESAHCESQDWAAEAMGAWAVELRVAKRATAVEQELNVAKVHLAETKAVLQKSLEALEAEQKARSDAEQEVVALRGRMLGAEESNTRLVEKVTRQEEGLSILESAHLGMYLFRLRLMPWFSLSFASELVVFF